MCFRLADFQTNTYYQHYAGLIIKPDEKKKGKEQKEQEEAYEKCDHSKLQIEHQESQNYYFPVVRYNYKKCVEYERVAIQRKDKYHSNECKLFPRGLKSNSDVHHIARLMCGRISTNHVANLTHTVIGAPVFYESGQEKCFFGIIALLEKYGPGDEYTGWVVVDKTEETFLVRQQESTKLFEG